MKNKLIFVNKTLNYYDEKSKHIKDIIINENIKIISEGIDVNDYVINTNATPELEKAINISRNYLKKAISDL